MSRFIVVPRRYLAGIATDCASIPTLYYHSNPLLRHPFWSRLRIIHGMILRHARARGSCLDFGAGGGVFAPTLAATFDRVLLADLVTSEARRLVADLRLANVEIAEGDACTSALPFAPFDAAVAADVLEHFRDPAVPITALRGALKPEGILLTSLPTENGLYRLLRRMFGIARPDDHYCNAYEVEAAIEAVGFHRLETRGVPMRIAPLFLITCWAT